MSQIFDIVEELEKERKKNKELQEVLDEIKDILEFRKKDTEKDYIEKIIFTKNAYFSEINEILDMIKGSDKNE